jgi:patatin-related protein
VALAQRGAVVSKTEFEVTQEVRFAVVIYGGVSLAIYINGVVQELLRLVRATAPGIETLTETEAVYRKLGQALGDPDRDPEAPIAEPAADAKVRTRFVIDVISGTSAGGINGVFLGKALANGQSLEAIKNLWYNEGDISLLLNDGGSRDARVRPQSRPTSVLNSARMYDRLFAALQGMNRPGELPTPLVGELDLFVTATDIEGLSLPISLLDGVVQERRHRSVLRFNLGDYNPEKQEIQNDFTASYDPLLAFAARCTSSFPVAFEPMLLADIDEVLQRRGIAAPEMLSRSVEYAKFFQDYADGPGGQTPHRARAFGDGGYLDNKPFSYAIDQLKHRRADVPVSRMLVYLEPSPDLRGPTVGSVRPDAIENALAALTNLPRYETIREDLQRIIHRNAEISRRRAVVKELERFVPTAVEPESAPPAQGQFRYIRVDGSTWGRQTVREVERDLGPAYAAYQRLKISSVLDDLLEQAREAIQIEEHSALHRAARALFEAWRRAEYDEIAGHTEAQFLLDFDMPYRLRRLEFVLSRADQLARLRRDQIGPNGAASLDSDWLKAAAAKIGDLDAYRVALFKLRKQLVVPLRELLEARARVKRFFTGLIESDVLWRILCVPEENRRQRGLALAQVELSQDGIRARAREVYEDPLLREAIRGAAERVAAEYRKTFEAQHDAMEELWKPRNSPEEVERARRHLAAQHHAFDGYDSLLFPITYNTDVGEGEEVAIVRISPADALTRSGPINDLTDKLRGTVFASFGAFFDRRWRENDLLWGRLDGAERLITALLPGTKHQSLRTKLIEEAHTAILEAELRKLMPNLSDRLSAFENHEVYRRSIPKRIPPETAVRTAGRASRIVGDLLDELADQRNVLRGQSAFVVRVSRVLWGLAEVSIPRSAGELIFRYAALLALAVQVVLLILCLLIPPLRVALPLLVRAITWTAAVVLCWLVVREYAGGNKRWFVALLATLGAVVAGLAIVGVGAAVADAGQVASWLSSGWAAVQAAKWTPMSQVWLAASFLLALWSMARMGYRTSYLRKATSPLEPLETEDLVHAKHGGELFGLIGDLEHPNRELIRSIVKTDFVFLASHALVLLWCADHDVVVAPLALPLGLAAVFAAFMDVVENLELLALNDLSTVSGFAYSTIPRIVTSLKFLLTGVAAALLGVGVILRPGVEGVGVWAELAAFAAILAGAGFAADALAVWRSASWRRRVLPLAGTVYLVALLAIVILAVLGKS